MLTVFAAFGLLTMINVQFCTQFVLFGFSSTPNGKTHAPHTRSEASSIVTKNASQPQFRVWTHLRKQATEALLAGWMPGDDQAPRLLTLSRSRLVGGAVVAEAYESTKRETVRTLQTNKC